MSNRDTVAILDAVDRKIDLHSRKACRARGAVQGAVAQT